MAQDNEGTVSPVGAVWKQVRDSVPGLELYSGDESHPIFAGTYVAACTFYATMWRKSPVGASYTGSLSAADASVIQHFAEKVVLDSTSTWFIGHADVVAEIDAMHMFGNTYEFTDNTTNADSVVWNTTGTPVLAGSVFQHTFPGAGIYTVTLTADNGCMTDVDTLIINLNPFNVNEVGMEVKIYPNPVQNLLNISSTENIQQIEVYDVSGKLILSKRGTNARQSVVDVSELSKGQYVLKVSSAAGKATSSFVK